MEDLNIKENNGITPREKSMKILRESIEKVKGKVDLEDLKTYFDECSICVYSEEESCENYTSKDMGTKCDIFKVDIKKIPHGTLASFIQSTYIIKTMEDTEELYIYEEGIFEPKGELKIEKLLEKISSENLSNSYISEVIGHIKRRTYTERKLFDADPNLIAVKNGILNIELNDLLPFSPYHLSIRKFPVHFDNEAKAETIVKFLEQICPNPEFRETLIEMIAYCLLNHHKYHVWMILVGEGDNGKTTFINLIKNFLGEENTKSISLQDLLTKRFLLSQLFGKMANIYDDLPKTPLKYTGIIKILTGGGQITCDIKHKNPITFTNTSKQIFSCNRLPKTEDSTHAFFSRPLIVELSQKFVKGDPRTDPNLLEKLTEPEELSGLLNICLKSIKNITERKKINYPFTADDMRNQYQRFSDPLAEYTHSNIIKDSESSVTKGKMYEDFVKYANEHKLTIMPSNVFSRMIKIHIVTLGGSDGWIGKDRAWNGVRMLSYFEKKKQKDLDDY